MLHGATVVLNSGSNGPVEHIVVAISVQPKGLGVRVEIETLCGWRDVVKTGAEVRFHYAGAVRLDCLLCADRAKALP
jgi:hypothetical protein